MLVNDIKKLLGGEFGDGVLDISGEGCDFLVTLASDKFIGLSVVKRQQLVYALLSEFIEDGRLHAITMHLYTTNEWKNHSEGLLR